MSGSSLTKYQEFKFNIKKQNDTILVNPLTSTMKVVQIFQQNSWFWPNCFTIKQGIG
jgi:hypothetical protein